MKRTITRPDGTTEVQEGTPEELRRFDGVSDAPKPYVPDPERVREFQKLIEDALPKLPMPQPHHLWQNQPCMVEEFFKTNPNGICAISCPCPRCSIQCVGTDTVQWTQQVAQPGSPGTFVCSPEMQIFTNAIASVGRA